MRVRSLIAGGTIALVCVLGPAANAYAQETTEVEVSHEAEECIHILEDGGEVDDCQEAPSPILPATNEIIWGVISFAVLAVALMKFAVPALQKGMAARSEKVRTDLAAAEKSKADADTMLADYRAQLADARNESNRMLEEARRSADALRADLQSRAQVEIAELRARAAADVEAAKVSAIADLRTEVASLAIGAAETIVQHSLDRETQVQLVENYINQVGSRQ
ncbi:MAG: F0F1 ATP synthase subunit B [Acidimicrobiales bacterium]